MTFLTIGEFTKPLPDIALYAKMRSGKDEVFKILRDFDFNVKRVAYGDVMKEKFFELFPNIPVEPKPIKEIIHFGQSMRAIDPDIWVNHAIGRLKMERKMLEDYNIEHSSAVFTDVRQMNEYEACKALGCVMVRIDSMEHIRVGRMIKAGEAVSEEILRADTELVMDNFEPDYIVENNGTRADLERNVWDLIYKIQSER